MTKETNIDFPSTWRWPIDLTFYDKSSNLTVAEYEYMKTLVTYPRSRGQLWRSKTDIILKRLLVPLYDLLDHVGAINSIKRKNTIRTTVICLLIRAMYKNNTSYWGFSTKIWHELLGKDYYAYVKHHGVTANARQQLIAVAYLLCNFNELSELGRVSYYVLSTKIFNQQQIDSNVTLILDNLKMWGYTEKGNIVAVRVALTEVLLSQRSPILSDITLECLTELYNAAKAKITKRGLLLISYVLVHLTIIVRPLGGDELTRLKEDIKHRRAIQNVKPEWLDVCERWFATSTLQHSSRVSTLYRILQAGRWFSQHYPNLQDLSDWTREICAEYVAAVDRAKIGQWSTPVGNVASRCGQPFAASSKAGSLKSMRTFFSDCQEWGWIAKHFNPARTLATPKSVRSAIGPNPRVIDDAIWAKIVWAGLNLTDADLLKSNKMGGKDNWKYYPPAMIRALAIVWLFSGLRRDEIMRLRVGCIRWQTNNTEKSEQKICMLDVPVNKTGTAFTKPVDSIIGVLINAWEAMRPTQSHWLDTKTGEKVQLLFSHRSKRLGLVYINKTLIRLLCHKAGVPQNDARGPITSHRARATIASQLYNAKEPLTLFELQDWLGHRSPESTRHYTTISPTVLAKSYAKAGYFARNIRAVEVLIDKEVIEGNRAELEPWKHYDLGHGYCSYDFFEQCPHRMACARCDFYTPKESTKAQLLEGKANLLHLRQEIPLTDLEISAVEGDLSAYEELINKLSKIPSPGR